MSKATECVPRVARPLNWMRSWHGETRHVVGDMIWPVSIEIDGEVWTCAVGPWAVQAAAMAVRQDIGAPKTVRALAGAIRRRLKPAADVGGSVVDMGALTDWCRLRVPEYEDKIHQRGYLFGVRVDRRVIRRAIGPVNGPVTVHSGEDRVWLAGPNWRAIVMGMREGDAPSLWQYAPVFGEAAA